MTDVLLAESKISEDNVALGVQQDILGLEVSVDNVQVV